MIELRWACEATTATKDRTLQYREFEVIAQDEDGCSVTKIIRDWTDVPYVVVPAVR